MSGSTYYTEEVGRSSFENMQIFEDLAELKVKRRAKFCLPNVSIDDSILFRADRVFSHYIKDKIDHRINI